MEEIADIASFRAAVNDNALILITDQATPTRLHSANCAYIKREYFEKKVVSGAGRTGAYYRVASVESALAEHGDVRCSKCLGRV